MCPSNQYQKVYVQGAAAISAFGMDWRGLGAAITANKITLSPARQLADSHGSVFGSEVAAIPAAIDVDARACKLMSYPARLNAVALRQVLYDTGWESARDEIAFYLGVGASGGSVAELTEMLRASIVDQTFTLDRFGTAGLAACNPLFAFQLMNNFTLCHGAIVHGIGGPNSAFYSRGNGTVAALSEAMHVVASGECGRALAGGADSALHPVTWAQLCRDGYVDQGFIPGEGAGLLALSRESTHALAELSRCEFHSAITLRAGAARLLSDIFQDFKPNVDDRVLFSAWGEPSREMLLHACNESGVSTVIDIAACLGDALAAAPALAWVAALDLVVTGNASRALVLNAGIDGGLGCVVLRRVV
ncbi:MAG: hypothetical protein HY080_06190 [Gammaproteobacteria bacterium]|nr:hypothetical protein [Gammaproteobacteria bacterium]